MAAAVLLIEAVLGFGTRAAHAAPPGANSTAAATRPADTPAAAPAVVSAPATAAILVKDFKFAPTPLAVKAGTTVTWKNQDNEPHTIVSDTGAFRSSALDTADTFAFTFTKPGTYRFTCSIHPYMTGTIVVE